MALLVLRELLDRRDPLEALVEVEDTALPQHQLLLQPLLADTLLEEEEDATAPHRPVDALLDRRQVSYIIEEL